MEEIIEKYALKNAVEHKGKAIAKAIFSKVVLEKPVVMEDVEFTMKLIEKVIAQVNRMSISAQKVKLLKIDPHILNKKEIPKKELKLPNVRGKVVMRYAPNPNAGMHIGNARIAIINDYFVKKYGGKFILRFDDTNPKNTSKKPNKTAYKQIREDLKWLGIKADLESYASKRIKNYYKVFVDLIKRNKVYVCTCDAKEWRERRRAGVACSCRMASIYENKRKWALMLNHDLKEGQAVCRIKTDMKYKDPAQRDWVAFRIIDRPNHPITKNEFHVWPMLDFASAIDDHEHGTTHIIRGQDLKISELRQKWIYNYLNWTYPTPITLGHMGFEGAGTFSKSEMMKGVKNGKYSGLDDPQLPMIASYRRRGFRPEPIRKLIVEAGITGGKIRLSEDMLAANNKNIIDSTTKRYFFVPEPVRVKVEGLKMKEVEVPNHPTNMELGSRKIKLSTTVYLSKLNMENMKKSRKTRLMEIGNAVKVDKRIIALKGSQEVSHEIPKIQWVSYKNKKCIVLLPNGLEVSGVVEETILKESIGSVVQFVRFGFVRLDKKKPLTFVFAHK